MSKHSTTGIISLRVSFLDISYTQDSYRTTTPFPIEIAKFPNEIENFPFEIEKIPLQIEKTTNNNK